MKDCTDQMIRLIKLMNKAEHTKLIKQMIAAKITN